MKNFKGLKQISKTTKQFTLISNFNLKNFSLCINRFNYLKSNAITYTSKKNFNDPITNEINNNFQDKKINKSYGERKKMAFIRDGMILSFSLSNSDNKDKFPYMFVDLKEFDENSTQNQKDERFVIIKKNRISQFLLLHPKAKVDSNNLEIIEFDSQYRKLTINQLKDNKYLVTLEVTPKEGAEKITSQIELHAAEIVILKMFAQKCIEKIYFQ